MEKWILSSIENVPLIVVTAIGIFIGVIVLTRISGKRSFSKMSSFDFAMTVAVGSLIATTILSKTVSLVEGLVGLMAIYALQLITAQLRKNHSVSKVIDNQPHLIMKDGKVLEKNLSKAMMTEEDLKNKLREANIIQLSEVKAVVMETTGNVSVLHAKDDKEIDSWLLEGVKTEL